MVKSTADKCRACLTDIDRYSPLKVMVLIPGLGCDGPSMIFAKRQADAIESLGASVHRFFLASRTAPLRIIQEWCRLRSEISIFNPDVIHCQYGTMTAFVAVCATNRPIVITFRGSDLNPVPSDNYLRTSFRHLLSQISAIRASLIICVSQELAGRLICGTNKTSVIPTGVDTSIFKPSPKNEARLRLGLGVGTPVVLFNAGRSPKVKRLDLAEMVMTEVRKSLPDATLVVLRGNIPPEDIPLYHNASDALLVTSDFEGSPTIVQEAIACGLPVVSVDVGDVSKNLHSIAPSRIVLRDPILLAAALLEVIALKQRSNGPEVAAKKFCNQVIGAQVLHVLRLAATH